jgi:hypothetical protein
MIPYIFGLAAIGLVMSLVLERPAERIDAAAKGSTTASGNASPDADK